MDLKLANNATSALAADITNVATTLTVTPGEGAKFPNPGAGEYFYMTIHQGSVIEIVKVTARATDSFTVERGQDDTAGVAFTTGAKVEQRLNKLQLAEYVTEKMLYEAANGLDRYKNYIFNSNALVNTDGWATFADLAAATPTDGTGGAPNITWTRNTTAPLNGIADFLLTKDAANRQGEGASYLCAIDKEDRNKELGISFNTIVASGTYTNNDLQIFAYDVTNAALLNNGLAILNVEAGSARIPHSASVLIPETCASVRFIVYEATTNATAYAIQFSNFKFTDNPFVYKNMMDRQYLFSPEAAQTSSGSSGDYLIKFTGTFVNRGPQILSVNNSGTYTIVTANRNCSINVLAEMRSNLGADFIWVEKNEDNVKILAGTAAADPDRRMGTSGPIDLLAGEYIVVHAYGYNNATNGAMLAITAIAESEHVVTPAKSGIEEIYYNGYTSNSTNLKYKTQQRNSLSKLASVDNTTYTKYTALKKVIASAFSSTYMASGGNNSAIVVYNSANTELARSSRTTASGGFNSSSWVGLLNPGDYIVTESSSSQSDITSTGFGATFVDFEQQILSAIPPPKVCYLKDVKAYNVDGGTSSTGHNIRSLNVINETGSNTTGSCSFVTLAANKFTIQTGKYAIKAKTESFAASTQRAFAYIRDDSAGANDVYAGLQGMTEHGSPMVYPMVEGIIEIAAPKTFEFKEYTSSGASTDGLGVAHDLSGYDNVYSVIEITKVK